MSASEMPVFRDSQRAPEERARDLVGRLTLAEKAGQLLHRSPAIERLGIAVSGSQGDPASVRLGAADAVQTEVELESRRWKLDGMWPAPGAVAHV